MSIPVPFHSGDKKQFIESRSMFGFGQKESGVPGTAMNFGDSNCSLSEMEGGSGVHGSGVELQLQDVEHDVLESPTIEAAGKVRRASESEHFDGGGGGGGGRARGLTFSASSPDNAPTILTWSDLTVETRHDPPKILINNISGTISGGFWAIMGASGGGKTTLLSTLSLRIDVSKMAVTGSMHLNGREYNTKNLKAMSAYVMQDDLLHAELTVAEVVSYAAKLRLPKMKEQQRRDREKEVLAMMGISHVKDVIIGDSRNKGISGGERKRVSIAVELLTKPALVFLDEPTSGLDSSTALAVCSTLQQLAHDGICTVVCTIHQPQVKIFSLFDNLILMKKGQIVYQGSAQKSLLFLEHAGMPCPAGVNPADHLIDSITPKDSTNAFDDNAKLKVPVNLNVGSHLELKSMTVASLMTWSHQFSVLFQRSMQQYFRRKDIILMNFVVTIVLAIFVSCGIWKNIGVTQSSVATRIPSLFFACVSQGIVAALQCISSFPSERAISLRERAAGTYDVSAYFAAKTVVDIITCSWSPTIFSIIVYWTIGYQPLAGKFFVYWIFMVLDAIAALSLATAVTCLCISIEMSTVVLSLLLEISRLYGGFFTSPLQLSEGYNQWQFADVLSYLKYTFVGIALNELEDLTLTCTAAEAAAGGSSCYTTGESISAAKGYDQYSIGFCAGILVVYIVGLRVIAYLGLRYLKS